MLYKDSEINNGLLMYEEYRLIERCETEINGAWKGAHLLLFFLTFVFGSFCTFCFHMLMYLFDEKCVLYPKLLSLTSVKHNVIYEFISTTKELGDMPVDFLSTLWVEKSACSLPTYVPLVSGIFGLLWTTMFLMCSTGTRTLTGLQRPWRVLPLVFVFSLAMGSLCIYSSVLTHGGLQELCRKLAEITGSPTCSYTVNVATLTYERRIRGVYQATRLTILSAWLHTVCWLLSALLALARVLLVVDFHLVRISVKLHGNIDKVMEKNEVQVRTVMPETWTNLESECVSDINIEITNQLGADDALTELMEKGGDLIYLAKSRMESSEQSLVPDESRRLARRAAIKRVPKDQAFIVNWLYDLVDKLFLLEPSDFRQLILGSDSSLNVDSDLGFTKITRQLGQSNISSDPEIELPPIVMDSIIIQKKKKTSQVKGKTIPKASTSKSPDKNEKLLKLYPESKHDLHKQQKKVQKSILKTIGVQTEKAKTRQRLRVQISESNLDQSRSGDDSENSTSPNEKNVDKETQTKEKEKQD